MLVSYRPLAAFRGAGGGGSRASEGETSGIACKASYVSSRSGEDREVLEAIAGAADGGSGGESRIDGRKATLRRAPWARRRAARPRPPARPLAPALRADRPRTAASAASAKKSHATQLAPPRSPSSRGRTCAVQMMATTALVQAHACTQTRQPRWLFGAASCVVHEQHPCAK